LTYHTDLLIQELEWGHRSNMSTKDKKFIDGAGKEIVLTSKDFKLVQQDTKIHDTKFNTKATTFFKDALKRFAKSKSAVVGGCIVGLLVLLAIIVPFLHEDVGVYNVGPSGGGKVEESSLSPKLFDAGTGFWDGTVKKTGILYDKDTQLPVGDQYTEYTVLDIETYIGYENVAHEQGIGGYVNVYARSKGVDGDFYCSRDVVVDPSYDFNVSFAGSDEDYNNFVFKGYKISFVSGDNKYFLVGTETDYSTECSKEINVVSQLANAGVTTSVTGHFVINVAQADKEGKVGHMLVSKFVCSSNNPLYTGEGNLLSKISFTCGNDALAKGVADNRYWESQCLGFSAYKIEFTYCNFRFDKYEYVYGHRFETISATEVKVAVAQNQLKILMDKSQTYGPTDDPEELANRYTILDENLFGEIVEQTGTAKYANNKWSGFSLKVTKMKYKDYGYSKMPRFIFGTSAASKDYCKLIFQGMRLSFVIAICVSSINIIIGLVWGSISGYFGGWTDILMERFCEIIGGLPTTVLITLCILYGNQWNWGAYADILALMMALFLTGWMGVAHTTRTQFYRYKGREYVLASRTLGAKDKRLIFKHILPNAAGTIITSSILMIPSVIYTEASIAYLKLGLQNQVLLGVILAEANNNYKGELAYTLYIPVLVMTLLLVSFNLFGNGLRDAFNPTLKGGK